MIVKNGSFYSTICDLEGEPHEVAAPVVAVLLHARGLLDPPVEAQVVTVAQEGSQEVTLLPNTLADPRDGIVIITIIIIIIITIIIIIIMALLTSWHSPRSGSVWAQGASC